MNSLLKKGAKLTPEYKDPPAESKWNWNKTVKYGAVAIGVGTTVGGIVALNHYTSKANYYTITCYGSQNGWEFQNAGFEEIEDTEPLILHKVF
jgi:hypothetical protein